MVRLGLVGLAMGIAFPTAAQAQEFQVGDTAECSGNIGKIARFDPRQGWDEPFAVVEVKVRATIYEFKCTPSQLKAVDAPEPGQPART